MLTALKLQTPTAAHDGMSGSQMSPVRSTTSGHFSGAMADLDVACAIDSIASRALPPVHDGASVHAQEDHVRRHNHAHQDAGAASSQALIMWLDQEDPHRQLGSHFGWGISGTEEIGIPDLMMPWEPLDSPQLLLHYVSNYFTYTHPILPFLDESLIRGQCHLLTSSPVYLWQDADFTTPLLSLIVSIGAASEGLSGSAGQIAKKYLKLAWKSLAGILGTPYKTSVRTLLLMSIAARAVSEQGRPRFTDLVYRSATRMALRGV